MKKITLPSNTNSKKHNKKKNKLKLPIVHEEGKKVTTF
jgi:hypothetical protein